MADILLLLCRIFVFAVFATAAIGKLMDLSSTRRAMENFSVPPSLSSAAAWLIPLIELTIALTALFVQTSYYSAIATLFILAVFSILIAREMLSGRETDCHCFGQIHSEKAGPKSLIRNLFLAVPPLVLVFAGSENQGLAPGRNGFEQALFSLVCMALLISALAFIELRKQSQKLEAALKRIEFLESIANDGRPIEFDDAGHPSDALPIGAEFPDFAIQNLDSRIVTFEHLLADFRPKLFFFVGPRCEPCKGLIPFFKDWKAKLEDKVRFVFISSGSKDENKNRFSDLATDDILIEEDRQLAKKVYAKWTPTALFVRADGKISSHPAVGDVAIKDFVEKIAKENFSSEGFYIANGSSEMSRIKIGSEVPEFELVSIDGKRITRDDFLGHETIALFLSVTCAYCQQVKDRLRVIEKEIANPKFIIFSDGEAEDYRGIELETPIILDKGYSVATKLGMLGAPSAVLINENGVIVSETAIGTNAIWSLLGKYD